MRKATYKQITVQTNVDFHEYIDFYQNGAPMDLTGYQFKLKFVDNSGAETVAVGQADLDLSHRIWFGIVQSSMANLPSSGVNWYLLVKDPDGYVGLIRYGRALTKGGAVWA